jgi:hypothetical protein
MPVFREFTFVGSALLLLLFVSGAWSGDESESRFDTALYESATYGPRSEQTAAVTELRFARDASPADRVREVFAPFAANEGRRAKR